MRNFTAGEYVYDTGSSCWTRGGGTGLGKMLRGAGETVVGRDMACDGHLRFRDVLRGSGGRGMESAVPLTELNL